MKKSIIAAGAASVALAAMPIVGAMAVNFTDVIKTTVGETCTFSRGTVASPTTTHGTGTWTTDTADPTKDILTAATISLDTETTIGTSNFKVVCNDPAGYQVTVGTNPLELPAHANTNSWNYNAGGAAPSPISASYWYLTSSDPAADLSANQNIVAKKTVATAAAGEDFTVTYKAYAKTGQDAGTYSADVTYTFADLGPNS